VLCIANNRIGVEGNHFVCAAVENNNTLETLDISGNKLNDSKRQFNSVISPTHLSC